VDKWIGNYLEGHDSDVFQNLPLGTEEDHENIRGFLVPESRYEFRISRI
jgi:hypothetical protein